MRCDVAVTFSVLRLVVSAAGMLACKVGVVCHLLVGLLLVFVWWVSVVVLGWMSCV